MCYCLMKSFLKVSIGDIAWVWKQWNYILQNNQNFRPGIYVHVFWIHPSLHLRIIYCLNVKLRKNITIGNIMKKEKKGLTCHLWCKSFFYYATGRSILNTTLIPSMVEDKLIWKKVSIIRLKMHTIYVWKKLWMIHICISLVSGRL